MLLGWNKLSLGSDDILYRKMSLAKSRFYWPNMKEDITHYVTKACRCLKQKPPAMKQREPLQPIITTAPFLNGISTFPPP